MFNKTNNEIISSEIISLEKLKTTINIESDNYIQEYISVKSSLEENANGITSSSKSKIDAKKSKIDSKRKSKVAAINKSIMKLKDLSSSDSVSVKLNYFFRRNFLTLSGHKTKKIIFDNKLVIMILAIALFAGFTNSVFFSQRNLLTNILKNNSTIGIMSLGMTFVILTGGIDLSVGSMLGFTSIFSMGFLLGGMPTLLAFILGIILAAVLGIIQGLFISFAKLPPFIVTLVGLLSIRGIIYIYADGGSKTDIGNKTFEFLQTAEFIGLSFIVWLLFILALMSIIILKYTKIGRGVYSVGGNEEAARLAGVNVKLVIIFVYAMSALFAGIASLVFASMISSAGPTSGDSYELDVIAAVVLGGTSLSGGKGGIGKTMLGWLVISTLGNALILIGYDANWQLVFKGLVILLAVILDKNFMFYKRIRKFLFKYI